MSPNNDQTNANKFLWNSLDRLIFIGVGVLGTVATTYFTGFLKINPPKLVATPVYNHIDSVSPVAKEVGGLKLDYEAETPKKYGILRVDFANKGRSAAEKVRFQVKVPDGVSISYYEEPDFKVYTPASMTIGKGEFYAELGVLPSGSHDFVALKIDGDEQLLKTARIKLVNDAYEGKVSSIDGL